MSMVPVWVGPLEFHVTRPFSIDIKPLRIRQMASKVVKNCTRCGVEGFIASRQRRRCIPRLLA